MASVETYTHRNLPHWYVPGAAHFVTYRLAGTIPVAVLREMCSQRDKRLRQAPLQGPNSAQCRAQIHKQFFAEYDRYLDNNRDIHWLTVPDVAAVVRENLYHHNVVKYHLLTYCIMPNHVHALLQPIEVGMKLQQDGPDEIPDSQSPLAWIMHSLKSYTAGRANRLLNRSGQFWQHESYDHWVRDDQELQWIVEYICFNPVRARLAQSAEQWRFSSAYDRFVRDGSVSGLLYYPT